MRSLCFLAFVAPAMSQAGFGCKKLTQCDVLGWDQPWNPTYSNCIDGFANTDLAGSGPTPIENAAQCCRTCVDECETTRNPLYPTDLDYQIALAKALELNVAFTITVDGEEDSNPAFPLLYETVGCNIQDSFGDMFPRPGLLIPSVWDNEYLTSFAVEFDTYDCLQCLPPVPPVPTTGCAPVGCADLNAAKRPTFTGLTVPDIDCNLPRCDASHTENPAYPNIPVVHTFGSAIDRCKLPEEFAVCNAWSYWEVPKEISFAVGGSAAGIWYDALRTEPSPAEPFVPYYRNAKIFDWRAADWSFFNAKYTAFNNDIIQCEGYGNYPPRNDIVCGQYTPVGEDRQLWPALATEPPTPAVPPRTAVTEEQVDDLLTEFPVGGVSIRGIDGVDVIHITPPPGAQSTTECFPYGILSPSNDRDLQTAIEFFIAADLAYTVRAAGTDALSCSEGWILDVSGFDFVDVDTHRRYGSDYGDVTVGAGVTWRQLQDELDRDYERYYVVGSWDPDASVVATTLAGGVGPYTPEKGLVCQQALGWSIVTPTGELLEPEWNDDYGQTDLFWALCGGGGNNFGVVTSVTLKLYKKHRRYRGLGVVLEAPGADAESFLDGLLSLELGKRASLRVSVVGSTVTADVWWNRGFRDFKKVVRDNKAFFDEYGFAVGTDKLSIFYDNSAALEPHASSVTFVVDEFTADSASSILAASAEGSTTITFMGEKIKSNKLPKTAFPWITAAAFVTVKGPSATTAQELKTSFGSTKAYVGFPDQSITDYQTQYYGENYIRLQVTKFQVDPAGLLTRPQGIEGSDQYSCAICWRSKGRGHKNRYRRSRDSNKLRGKWRKTLYVSCEAVADRQEDTKDQSGKCNKNDPLYAGCGAAAGIAVIGAGGVLLVRRRKKDSLKNRLETMATSGDERGSVSVQKESTQTKATTEMV